MTDAETIKALTETLMDTLNRLGKSEKDSLRLCDLVLEKQARVCVLEAEVEALRKGQLFTWAN